MLNFLRELVKDIEDISFLKQIIQTKENSYSILNILDIIQIVDNITIDADFDCHADINEDLHINILDVVILVDLILN